MSSPKLHEHDHATKMTKPTITGAHGAVKKVVEKRGGHDAWGKPGRAEIGALGVLNRSDPNFDEYTEGSVVLDDVTSIVEEKEKHKAIHDLLTEFIDSGDVREAILDLKDKSSIDPCEFVYDAIVFGLDHKAYDRELISQLISAAHPIFEGKGYDEGFQKILFELPDLTLDTPDAAEFVGLFMARAIYDDAMAPAFVKNAKVDNELAKLAVTLAFHVVHEPSERSRLENIWGPAAVKSVDKLREEIGIIFKEYMEELDLAEAERAILALNSPSFHSQVVKQALFIGIEMGNHKPKAIVLDLLEAWIKAGIINEFAFKRGLELAKKGIDEILLDVPNAVDSLKQLEVAAVQKKLLTAA